MKTIYYHSILMTCAFFALSGCTKNPEPVSSTASAASLPAETSAVASITAEPAESSSVPSANPAYQAVEAPAQLTMDFEPVTGCETADQNAVSDTYQMYDQSAQGDVDIQRFPDRVSVSSVEYGDDGYTHYVLKDAESNSDIRFAVMSELPDLKLFIYGSDTEDNGADGSLVIFAEFDLDADENHYGQSWYLHNYAVFSGISYQTYAIVQDGAAFSIKGWGSEPVETENGWSMYSNTSGGYSYSKQIHEQTDVSDQEKTELDHLDQLNLIKLE